MPPIKERNCCTPRRNEGLTYCQEFLFIKSPVAICVDPGYQLAFEEKRIEQIGRRSMRYNMTQYEVEVEDNTCEGKLKKKNI